MQTRAAVARQAGQPLSLETVELEGPRAGEVLVEIKATGSVTPMSSRSLVLTPRGFFQLSWVTKARAWSWMSAPALRP